MNVFNVVYIKPERKKKLLSQHNKNHNEFEGVLLLIADITD